MIKKKNSEYYLIRFFNGLDYEGAPLVVNKEELKDYDTVGSRYRAGGYDDHPIFRWTGWDIIAHGEDKAELESLIDG